MENNSLPTISEQLITDLRQIIDTARTRVATTANYELTAMYWHIGNRINRDILNNERAEYGKQIVSQVATQLQEIYGSKGFEEWTIRRMAKFAQLFPDFQILTTLLSKLSWSHFLTVMPLKDELQREFLSDYGSQRALECKDASNQNRWYAFRANSHCYQA